MVFMELIRKTYAEIDLRAIESNVRKIINKYNSYKYYFGVIKADSYGRGDIRDAKSMIKGGCNYLAVATPEEGLNIRREINDIPILCLGNIDKNYIEKCYNNNITISITSLEYLKEIMNCGIKKLKVHIKLNTGMNRLRNIGC